jgi:hypothetical protein
MSIISETIDGRKLYQEEGEYSVISWANLANGDDGAPVQYTHFADRSVQVSGTFGGATVHIEGSIDGTNYEVLTDPQGNNLSLVAAKIEAITEATRYIRPRVSGGDGTTSINVAILVRR